MSGFNICILIIIAFLLLGCGEKPELVSSQLIRGYEITHVKPYKHVRVELTNPTTKHSFSQYLRKRCSKVSDLPANASYTVRETIWRYTDGETEYEYDLQVPEGFSIAEYFCNSDSPLYKNQ